MRGKPRDRINIWVRCTLSLLQVHVRENVAPQTPRSGEAGKVWDGFKCGITGFVRVD